MASDTKQNIAKVEYVTKRRTATLKNHLERYIRWGFENIDEKHTPVLVQSAIDHEPDMRNILGHQDEDDDDGSSFARDARRVEHGVERNMIVNTARGKFKRATDATNKFVSDQPENQFQTIIRFTVSEAPTSAEFEPGTHFSDKQVEQIRKGLEKEAQHEVGDDVEGLEVEVQHSVGTKTIGKLAYHGEPIKSKYKFAVYLVSFNWKTQPITDLKKTNHQMKVGKTEPMVKDVLDKTEREIREICQALNITAAEFINLIDTELK